MYAPEDGKDFEMLFGWIARIRKGQGKVGKCGLTF